MIDLSIVIVSYNTKKLTLKCLESVFKETKDVSLEVFIVDNASSDGSVLTIRKEFPQVSLIVNKENLGFARANNQAIKQAKGRYILLLNSDTEVLENALGEMVAFMGSHKDIGILGPKLLNSDSTLQPSAESFPSLSTQIYEVFLLSKIFPKSKEFGKLHLSWWDFDSGREVDKITGAAFLIRREVIEKIGLLDENFFMYYEEVDFCKRAKEAGFKVYFYPKAKVTHHWSASSGRISFSVTSRSLRSMNQYFSKHNGFFYMALMNILTFLTAITNIIAILPFRLFGKGKDALIWHLQVLRWYLQLKWIYG